MFSDNIDKYLESALDFGLRESEFWDMTLLEFQNFLDSKTRCQKAQQQEKATYDYILADLIGRSMARIYNSSNKYPEIYEAYPTLFSKEEMERKEQERRTELSALRLQEFLKSFNEKKNKKKEVELD